MSARPPKWKRLGFSTDAEYRAACSAKRKTEKASLLATALSDKGYTILRVMWAEADFHAPRVTITKEQMMKGARCSLRTLKDKLAELRTEGSIKPVKNHQGGRGIPTTWRLCVAGCDHTPSDAQIEAMDNKQSRQAAFKFLAQKYGGLRALEMMGDGSED